MNKTYHRKITLLSRNEGKLKSFDSCFDLRAWSHDTSVRDLYLRDWMKCDMPTSFFPVSTINNLLKSMSCRQFGPVTPRCHPDCKSKDILNSICSTCQAMKQCLKSDKKLEHFFEEEEFETGHWPCDRCLSALKSIKMFWKVILNKIFKINNIPKAKVISREHSVSSDCVYRVVKDWQKEILEQAAYVKKMIPSITNNSCFLWRQSTKSDIDIFYPENEHQHCGDNTCDFDIKSKNCKHPCKCSLLLGNKTNGYAATSTIDLLDIGCDPVNININEKLKSSISSFKRLQERLETQAAEVKKLKIENITLHNRLLEECNKRSQKTFRCSSILNSVCDIDPIIKPFEIHSEENSANLTKDNNSEVIITVKNYKNEDFRHVCMLQVIRKTNQPTEDFTVAELDCCKEHDPVNLLTKVQKTFGNIVSKELSLANKRHNCTTGHNINASYGEKPFYTSSSATISSCWSRC